MKQLAKTKALQTIRHQLDDNAVEIVMTEAVTDFLALKADLEAEIKATWNAIEAYMLKNDIKTVGQLTIAERKSWKVQGQLPPRFYKQTLDTTRLNFMLEHGDNLPAGASYSVKPYLTKTNRKVEA